MAKEIVRAMSICVITLATFAVPSFAARACKVCSTSTGCGLTVFDGYTSCTFDQQGNICTLRGTCSGQWRHVPGFENVSLKSGCSREKIDYATSFPWTTSSTFADRIASYDIDLASVVRAIQKSVKTKPVDYVNIAIKMKGPTGDVLAVFYPKSGLLKIAVPVALSKVSVKDLVFKGNSWTLRSGNGQELGTGTID